MSRIDDLLHQLTLDEKIAMLAGCGVWYSTGVPRLAIPAFRMADGPNGVRGVWSEMSPTSAATPVGVALGATWNPDLVEKVGGALAEEVKDKGGHVLLAPTVNIPRTPIAGRNFECFSEDPYLSGTMAAAYVKGLQRRGVGACIKHFVANDQEYQRTTISAEVDERALREIYLEPFRIAIREAKPWTVMSAYNRVNGRYACENDPLLREILKQEWGFDGAVISDWFGTYDDEVPAGGLDLEMPGPARWMAGEVVKKALASGALTQAALDDKVRRLLGVVEKAGLLDDATAHPERANDDPARRQIIREAADEAIVLLKNDGLLPLKNVKTIAVIGPHAEQASIFGGGSSSSFLPHYVVSPLEGIRSRAGEGVEVVYAPGCLIHKTLPAPAPDTLSTADGERGLSLRLYDGIAFSGDPVHTQVTSLVDYSWFHHSVPNADQESFSMIQEGFFTPQESGKHRLALGGVGWSRLFLDGRLLIDHTRDADLGQELIGEIELQGGRAYPIRLEYYWQGSPRWRSVKLGHLPPQPADPIGEAVELARKSDVVVLVASLNREWEAEGFDRIDMQLPGAQNELIQRVTRANPNTVVVVNTGSPVEMPWIDDAPAVVQLWYNGQEAGSALADALFGVTNPSGKLPTTFPARLEDNPAYLNYPGEQGKVRYGEGIFVGYRYYDKKRVAPLFPFGHGLSYTTFEYGNLRVSAETLTPDDTLHVSVDVTNTGAATGKEIVQLYVHDAAATFARPEQELKAFRKVEIAPGQTTTVTFTLDREAFWYYDAAQGRWNTEAGAFDLLVGASSRDIRQRVGVWLKESARGSRLHGGCAINMLMGDADGRAILLKYLGGVALGEEIKMAGEFPLEQFVAGRSHLVSQDTLAQIERELAALG